LAIQRERPRGRRCADRPSITRRLTHVVDASLIGSWPERDAVRATASCVRDTVRDVLNQFQVADVGFACQSDNRCPPPAGVAPPDDADLRALHVPPQSHMLEIRRARDTALTSVDQVNDSTVETVRPLRTPNLMTWDTTHDRDLTRRGIVMTERRS